MIRLTEYFFLWFICSADPKFHNLVEHVLEEEENGNEIGMIGFNPHTGRPLNVGVTLEVTPDCVRRNKKDGMITLNCQAKRQFEVQGEPWLHNNESGTNNPRASQSSFYLADIEIVDGRTEEALRDDVAQAVQNLSDQIPGLVETWIAAVVSKKKQDVMGMRARMMELGPLPEEYKDRALWVSALMNPSTSHSASAEERVCLEIRPAMLSCKNNHERMVLATAALQSSIDHVTGKKKLF